MLSYLHACAAAVGGLGHGGVCLIDVPGDHDAGGHFIEVVLRPRVTVTSPDMVAKAAGLHREAHQKCFIASSVNFPVRHEPVVRAASTAGRPG